MNVACRFLKRNIQQIQREGCLSVIELQHGGGVIALHDCLHLVRQHIIFVCGLSMSAISIIVYLLSAQVLQQVGLKAAHTRKKEH